MDEGQARPGHCCSLESVEVVIRLAPLAGLEEMKEGWFSVWKAAWASMVMWMASEQTQAVDLSTIHDHAALHSGSKPEPKTGQIAGSPTFEWRDQDSRICDVNRNLVFEDVPLKFRDLRTRRVRGVRWCWSCWGSLTSPPPEANSLETM